VGIGVTGLVTYGYFSLASHALSKHDYGGITLLWSAVFITVSILYRPVEQLLSRTIADREARRQPVGQAIRVAATIQLGLGVLFAAVTLALRGRLRDGLFSGDDTLYWILLGAVLAYAVSYFARGYLAGRRRFGLYGLLVLMEATSRIMFALVVVIGIADGQSVVATGILAAPLISLVVVPFAFTRTAIAAGDDATAAGPPAAEAEFTLAHGSGFAAAVLLIMFSEQTFLNAGPLLIKASEGAAGVALAGFVFNILLLARAPLQLFQAISTSLLPHLTNLHASGADADQNAFRHSVRVTLLAVTGFAAAMALAMLAAGPDLMKLAFGAKQGAPYDRVGLVIVAAGMGLYLSAATLNQAALAQAQARRSAVRWIACAAVFVAWVLLPVLDPVRRVEVGFSGTAALLCVLLYALYARPRAHAGDVIRPGSTEEMEAVLAAADEGT
jgi:hypothetical protein